MANSDINALADLLKVTAPPSIPPMIELLETAEYAEVALACIDNHEFKRRFAVYNPKKLNRAKPAYKSLSEKGRIRYKIVLSALVTMDRSIFQHLHTTLDADAARRNFIREEILQKREELEEQGSRYCALVELVRSRTRTPSAQATALTTLDERNRSVVTRVKKRDNYRCRLTGFLSTDLGPNDPIQDEENPLSNYTADLEVVHGLPYAFGGDAWEMLERITGASFNGWEADHPANAIFLHRSLHTAFAAFKIYFEMNENKDMVVRYRTEPEEANPTMYFGLSGSPRHPAPLIYDKETLRPVPATDVPQPDVKYFLIHKALGDVYWMVASAQPEILHRQADEEFTDVLSDDNFLEYKLHRGYSGSKFGFIFNLGVKVRFSLHRLIT